MNATLAISKTNKLVIYKAQSQNAEFNYFFFLYLGFLSLNNHDSKERKGGSRPVLTLLYYFHLLREHLILAEAITAESSPLHIASDRTRTGNTWF